MKNKTGPEKPYQSSST